MQPREKVLRVTGRGVSRAGRGASCNWGDALQQDENVQFQAVLETTDGMIQKFGVGIFECKGSIIRTSAESFDCRADEDDNTLHSNYVFGDSSIALRADCSSCRRDNDGADFEIACAMADQWSTARNLCSNSCTVSSNKLSLHRKVECVGRRAPSDHSVDPGTLHLEGDSLGLADRLIADSSWASFFGPGPCW